MDVSSLVLSAKIDGVKFCPRLAWMLLSKIWKKIFTPKLHVPPPEKADGKVLVGLIEFLGQFLVSNAPSLDSLSLSGLMATCGRQKLRKEILRLSQHTDMTIRWKALEEHFLMVPLAFQFTIFGNAFSEFKKKAVLK
jgi:hypothetical protein